jgi:hypothetical protein
MENDLLKAAEVVLAEYPVPYVHTDSIEIGDDALDVIVSRKAWQAAQLLARERLEDETPIDEAWLESIGFKKVYNEWQMGLLWWEPDGIVGLYQDEYKNDWVNVAGKFTTRGQLLKLLSALNITKESPNA